MMNKRNLLLLLAAILPMIQAFANDSGTCGSKVIYTFEEATGTLTITGEGKMTDYKTIIAMPWADYKAQIVNVIIGYGVTSIGKNAFYGCNQLTTLTIPSTVATIGTDAFYYCSRLSAITVDSENPIFDSRDDCNAIIKTETNQLVIGSNNTTIPSTVTSIGMGAFRGYVNMTTINIPSNVTSIGNVAFAYCSKLKSVYIYAPQLDYYGNSTFNSNADGRKIYVPEKSLGTYQDAWSDYAADIVAMSEVLPKLETPTISVVDGRLKFSCATEGVTFHYSWTTPQDGTGDEVAANSVVLNVYATKEGYQNSDVAMMTVSMGESPIKGDVNGDGRVDIVDVTTTIDIILNK